MVPSYLNEFPVTGTKLIDVCGSELKDLRCNIDSRPPEGDVES
jgi:hypothetical protein